MQTTPASAPASSNDDPRPAVGIVTTWPEPELRLSVVVPTCRRPHQLRRCLEALIAQSLDGRVFEVIVVDHGRTPDSQAVVNAFARAHERRAIRYVRPETRHVATAARDTGWKLARSPIVAFTDDDTAPCPDWLSEGERALRAEDVVAASGRVVSTESSGGDDVTSPSLADASSRDPAWVDLVSGSAFVRRDALVEVGGFDARFAQTWREFSDLQFSLIERGLAIGRCDTAVVVRAPQAQGWPAGLRDHKDVFYDALLFKKHPRVYRERVLGSAPLLDYLVVGLVIATIVLWACDVDGSAAVSGTLALAMVSVFAASRLRRTAPSIARVTETVVTCALSPFLSVYWRLRGAIHFRVRHL